MTRSAHAVRPAPVPEQRRAPSRRPRITVGTDGSTWGNAALDWALRHAWLLDATVRVHVGATCNEQVITRKLYMYRWVHASVVESTESPVAAMVAASGRSELLTIGYRGHAHGPLGVGHSVLPLVTVAHCDVVVVRGEPKAVHGEYGWITAAVTGVDDDAVIRRAVRMATHWRTGLRFVHAAPLPVARPVPGACGDPVGVVERAREKALAIAPTLTTDLRVLRCPPHEAMRGCGRSDLLVVGPGNRQGRLSLITSAAVHLAPCPVLIARTA